MEKAVAELFRAKGYEAAVSGGTNDLSIDIILENDGEKAVVMKYVLDRPKRIIRSSVSLTGNTQHGNEKESNYSIQNDA